MDNFRGNMLSLDPVVNSLTPGRRWDEDSRIIYFDKFLYPWEVGWREAWGEWCYQFVTMLLVTDSISGRCHLYRWGIRQYRKARLYREQQFKEFVERRKRLLDQAKKR